MKGRIVPARALAQQKAADRRAALLSGDLVQIRAWATQYDVPLVNPDDDELLLISMHEARVTDPTMPARIGQESQRWLDANKARIVKEREAK